MDTTPDAILGLARDFMRSRVLLTAAELDLFTLLSGRPAPAEEVASRLGTTVRGTAILLDALAAMGLLDKADGAYRCPAEVAELLSSRAPTSVLPMVRHAETLWGRWSGLTEVVTRGAAASQGDPSFSGAQRDHFIGAMHIVGRDLAGAVVAALDPGASRRALDVGGATGTYAQALLEANPAMRATIFDLAPVVELARQRLAPTGLLPRITLVAGDFYADELPPGHDLVLLSAIIHQNSPQQNRDLYAKVLRALEPGGRVVIRDHVMDDDRTRPARGAFFAVNMLVGTAGGTTYTFPEIRESLVGAGFVDVRLLQADDGRMNGLVAATRPGRS